MSWKSRSIDPPHLGIGLDSKISSDRNRNSRIQSGSFLISDIWFTISRLRPFLALKTPVVSVRKLYLLISPISDSDSALKSVDISLGSKKEWVVILYEGYAKASSASISWLVASASG